MAWVNEFFQSLLVLFKFTTNYNKVTDDSWTHFCDLFKETSGHKGLRYFERKYRSKSIAIGHRTATVGRFWRMRHVGRL